MAGEVEERLWRLGFGERTRVGSPTTWMRTRAGSAVTEPHGSTGSRHSRTSGPTRGRRGSSPSPDSSAGGRGRSGTHLAAIVEAQLASPPAQARVVVAADCFPTGFLGHWVRRLAEGGLAAWLTATSPPRLAHPDGGPPLAGTNPLAIAVLSDGRPFVADVSMGKVTYGDVLTGEASPDDLVPFGGDQAHKAFALALGLQALVDALAGLEHGALLVVAAPGGDLPALRARAGACGYLATAEPRLD